MSVSESRIRELIRDEQRRQRAANVKATADFVCETPVVREVATVVVSVLDIFGL